MTLDATRRSQITRIVQPIGGGLARLGLTANGLTGIGFALVLGAAGMILVERYVVAGILLALGGLADLFDGAVARARGGTTGLGGFYDSVADRISDGAVLAAVAWVLRDEPLLFALAALALVASEVTSYARAKAESLGIDCSVGLLERAERTILLVAGLVFHRWLHLAVAVLALGATITVIQRVVHVRRLARASGAHIPAAAAEPQDRET